MLFCIGLAVLVFVIYLARYVAGSRNASNANRLFDTLGNKYSVSDLYPDATGSRWMCSALGYLLKGRYNNETNSLWVYRPNLKQKTLDFVLSSSFNINQELSAASITNNGQLLLASQESFHLLKISPSGGDFKTGEVFPVIIDQDLKGIRGVTLLPNQDTSNEKLSTFVTSDGSNKMNRLALDLSMSTAKIINQVEISSSLVSNLQLGSLTTVGDFVVAVQLNSNKLVIIDIDESRVTRVLDLEPIMARISRFKRDQEFGLTSPQFATSVTYDPSLSTLSVTGDEWNTIVELSVIKSQFTKK
jgi:hypothetical protein